jgi:hypothetical protein
MGSQGGATTAIRIELLASVKLFISATRQVTNQATGFARVQRVGDSRPSARIHPRPASRQIEDLVIIDAEVDSSDSSQGHA